MMMDSLSQNFINKSIGQWHLTLNLCVENNEWHIEHLLS